MPRKVREFTAADVADAEKLYRITGDLTYIVLAIGDNCAEPPFWALVEAQTLARRAKSASLGGNDRAKWGVRLDAMFWEFFHQRDKVPLADPYTPPSPGSVARTILANEGITSEREEYESSLKGLLAAWKREAKGHHINGEGLPENARWQRMLRAWGDKNSPFPYADALDNMWKLERMLREADHRRRCSQPKEKTQATSFRDDKRTSGHE